MVTKIENTLKLSQEEYETIIFRQWSNWCIRHSFSIQVSQKLICSKSLFNWWQVQYKKLELEFLEDTEPYTDMNQIDALTAYMRTVNKIHFIYSKPLITKALKNDTKTNPQQN